MLSDMFCEQSVLRLKPLLDLFLAWGSEIPSPGGQSTSIRLSVYWSEATDKASSQECVARKLDEIEWGEGEPISEGEDESLKNPGRPSLVHSLMLLGNRTKLTYG